MYSDRFWTRTARHAAVTRRARPLLVVVKPGVAAEWNWGCFSGGREGPANPRELAWYRETKLAQWADLPWRYGPASCPPLFDAAAVVSSISPP